MSDERTLATDTTDGIPMVLKGWRLHAALNRENEDGLREGLRFGALFATIFWLIVGGLVWAL